MLDSDLSSSETVYCLIWPKRMTETRRQATPSFRADPKEDSGVQLTARAPPLRGGTCSQAFHSSQLTFVRRQTPAHGSTRPRCSPVRPAAPTPPPGPTDAALAEHEQDSSSSSTSTLSSSPSTSGGLLSIRLIEARGLRLPNGLDAPDAGRSAGVGNGGGTKKRESVQRRECS